MEISTQRKTENHSRDTSMPHVKKPGDSQMDSERDSGFSDASNFDTTDSEDSLHPQLQQDAQASASGPQPSQLAVVGGSYSNLSPMIIMNNVLLKQSRDNPPALKPWGFSPTVEMVQPVVQQPHVVFLQPVVSPASKEASSRHRRSKNYLPILKSYPKIAPHPRDSSSSSGRGTASSSSSSSTSSMTSSGSERGTPSQRELFSKEKRHRRKSGGAVNLSSAAPSVPTDPSAAAPLPQGQLFLRPTEGSGTSGQPELPVFHSSTSSSQTVTVPAPTATEVIGLQPPEQPKSPSPDDGNADTKRKRFCNTYNIMSKTGLLDIAMRTTELNRLNRRTQTDLDRLREHTDLLLQGLLSGDSSIYVKLQACLQQEEIRKKEEEKATHPSFKADKI